jgi:hypothetical protein
MLYLSFFVSENNRQLWKFYENANTVKNISLMKGSSIFFIKRNHLPTSQCKHCSTQMLRRRLFLLHYKFNFFGSLETTQSVCLISISSNISRKKSYLGSIPQCTYDPSPYLNKRHSLIRGGGGQFEHYKGKVKYFEYLRAGQAQDRKTQPLIIPPSPPLSPLLSNSLSFLDNFLRDKQQGRKQ